MTDLLTERELQVLQLMSHGLMNREIGRQLFLADTTIKTHVQRILKKLQAADRTHAVRRGFEMRLLQLGTEPTPPLPPPETPLAAAIRVTSPKDQLYAAMQSLGWTPPGGGHRA